MRTLQPTGNQCSSDCAFFYAQIQGECDLLTKWGGECDSLMQNGLKLLRKEQV